MCLSVPQRATFTAKWFEEAKLNEAMQWLGRGYTPARRTWYDFRDRIGGAIDRLHEQMIQTAIEDKLLDPAEAAQDGTSVAACASRHQCQQGNSGPAKALLNHVIDGKHSSAEHCHCGATHQIGRRDLFERMQRAETILNERIAKNAKKTAGTRKSPARIQVSLTDPIAPLGRDKRKCFVLCTRFNMSWNNQSNDPELLL